MSDNVIPLFGGQCCGARHRYGFFCTADVGHDGEHIAEGPDEGEVWAKWPQ